LFVSAFKFAVDGFNQLLYRFAVIVWSKSGPKLDAFLLRVLPFSIGHYGQARRNHFELVDIHKFSKVH
jgi:hypothetical protein